jgi:hypothetical protein
MAVLGRLILGSAERLDLPDLLSIDSFTAADFKYLIKSFIGGDKPYILRGFDIIQPQDSIGTESISIRIADSVVYYPAANAGAFYYGLEEGNVNAEPLVPELRKNATNYVYLTFSTFDNARDSRAFWDPDQNGGEGGEFSQDINTQSVLSIEVNVSTASFPENTIPIAKIDVGASVIDSIQDARDMMFRLGTGGLNPNPFSNFAFRELPSASESRQEPSTIMTSAFDTNPFQGGDKNIYTLKEWMDIVMTLFKEVTGNVYWYQSGATIGAVPPNLQNIFHDALGSTIKSKGQWEYDESTLGQATWTEDIHLYTLTDPRDIIVRAESINLSSDDYVAWLGLVRDADINASSFAVDFVNGSDNINGIIGAFANINKGDWIKKITDSKILYLRVEELYASTNQGGGTTTPALAQSIKLSDNYAGTTASELAVYTKGEYLLSDINITSRTASSIQDAGGDFYWMAYRSDTVLGFQSATPTQLTVDITEVTATQAKCTSAGHGLVDGDRINITTGSYVGEYKVEVESTDVFYINTTVNAGDELGQTAFYAIITTRARSTDDGYSLETAEHNFENDQLVHISGTASAYDGSFKINVRSAVSFQIPFTGINPNPGPVDGEIIRLSRLNVRTEFGTVKIVQGETIDIGDPDTENIMTFIGMDSLAQTIPDYSTPLNYNALDGAQNYNSLSTDNLTERASKLTAMMADRVQERGMRIIGRINITNETDGINQNLISSSQATLVKPGSPDQGLQIAGSMAANTALIANIDRDLGNLIVPTVESIGSPNLLAENKFIIAYRFADQNIHLWNGTTLRPFDHTNLDTPEDAQNKNISLFVPGSVLFDSGNGNITFKMARIAQESQIEALAGNLVPQSSYFLLSSAGDATLYYAWFNVDAGGVDPAIGGRTGIEIAISSGDTDIQVADAIVLAIDAIIDFNASNVDELVTIVNDAVGFTTPITDFNTGLTITTLCAGADPDPIITLPGSANENFIDSDTINGLGTLSLDDQQAAWIRVNRFAAKTFNGIETDPSIEDTDLDGRIYITNIDLVPVDQDCFVIFSRNQDSLIQYNKSQVPDTNVYEEIIDVVAGLPANQNEIQGPVPVGTQLILPPDQIGDNTPQTYLVGAGFLEIYLNGQRLLKDRDYLELGQPLCESNKIELLQQLQVDDVVLFRIDSNGGVYFAASAQTLGGTSLQGAYESGRTITTQSGQPVIISGPINEKLVIIQGDLDVTGIIDPIALQFTTQASNPMAGTDRGLWVNNSDELIFESVTDTALNVSEDLVRRDGSRSMLADLDMDNNFIINLPDPTLSGHAMNKNYADATYLRIDGSLPVTGDLNMANFSIVNLNLIPLNPNEATSKQYVDNQDLLLLPLDGSRSMTSDLDFGSNLGINAADPVNPQDIATKNYVDLNAGGIGNFITKTNGGGVSINAGDVVYVNSITDEVELALADDINTVKGTIGVAQETIAPAASGKIQVTGEATISTVSALTPGEFVYVSDSIAGSADDIAPSAIGSHIFILGVAVATDRLVLIPNYRYEQENTYEESLEVISGAPANDNEVTGPIVANTILTIPLDGRNLDSLRQYRVGSGDLQVFLNGNKLELDSDWEEVGALGTLSNQIRILLAEGLVVTDELIIRDAARTTNITSGGGGGATELNELIDVTISGLTDEDILQFNQGTGQWENTAAIFEVNTASNVGIGEGEVFKQKTGVDLELRNIKAGDGIIISQDATDIEISLNRNNGYFRDDVDNQPSVTIFSSQEYIMHTNALDVYRNGVLMIMSPFMNDRVTRYLEATRNSIVIDPGEGPAHALAPVASDVFSFINRDAEPTYKVIITGQSGTTLNVPTYSFGTGDILVFRNGLLMNDQGLGLPADSYIEASATSLTLAEAANTDDIFVIIRGTNPLSREDRNGETGTFLSGLPAYSLGTEELLVYKNGILLFNSTTLGTSFDRYQETSITSITLEEAATIDDVFAFIVK